jgi:hypothetical protein
MDVAVIRGGLGHRSAPQDFDAVAKRPCLLGVRPSHRRVARTS